MSDEVLATMKAAPGRRWFGLILLVALGLLVLYVAAARPPALGWQALLVAVGIGSFWMARAMHRATGLTLTLTREALSDSEGRVVARIEDVAAVDRGMFAMKPSNGFVLKMRNAQPRAWRPGVYWSLGRRVAVGGVMPASQSKPMADSIAIMVATRGQGEDG
ncbi:hypothetical protein [Roseivivax sp.]